MLCCCVGSSGEHAPGQNFLGTLLGTIVVGLARRYHQEFGFGDEPSRSGRVALGSFEPQAPIAKSVPCAASSRMPKTPKTHRPYTPSRRGIFFVLAKLVGTHAGVIFFGI